MAQQHKGTAFDRYPRQFRIIQERLGAKQGKRLRILSFGCSTGEEMKTIRRYFPSAKIFGCDVDLSRVRRKLPGRVFLSEPAEILSHGPYHVIFANSVLCLHPVRGTIADSFPFREFENLFQVLHNSLRRGGIICAYNPSYRFRDLKLLKSYRPLRMRGMGSNGFLPLYDQSGKMLINRSKRAVRVLDRTALTASDVIDCVFEQRPGPPLYVGRFAWAWNVLSYLRIDLRFARLETAAAPAKDQR